MKKWICVQVMNHHRVAQTIESHQEKGWTLHSYQATQSTQRNKGIIMHYLLFEQPSTDEDYVS
jgi:hypothetical protein